MTDMVKADVAASVQDLSPSVSTDTPELVLLARQVMLGHDGELDNLFEVVHNFRPTGVTWRVAVPLRFHAHTLLNITSELLSYLGLGDFTAVRQYDAPARTATAERLAQLRDAVPCTDEELNQVRFIDDRLPLTLSTKGCVCKRYVNMVAGEYDYTGSLYDEVMRTLRVIFAVVIRERGKRPR